MQHGRNRIAGLNFKTILTWIVPVFFISLVNGCTSTMQTKDGAPDYPTDVSNIPDAKPKPEKLAKYGNKPVYRVLGKKYHVMSSAKNYHERGIASWYGTKFNRARTSSGEPYDMLAMTAAHKTLPLPTYVEVTNLKNGNKVIVKINDRGPFSSKRLIDLSYVAAKKLDMIGHGTTYVNVKAIDPTEAYEHPELLAARHAKSKKAYAAIKSDHSKSVYLRVGSFKNRLYAEKLKKRLIPVAKSHVAITHLSKTSKKLYRVDIGPLRDVAAADSIKKKLRALGLTAQHIKA
jgi:rare lipoprotein A